MSRARASEASARLDSDANRNRSHKESVQLSTAAVTRFLVEVLGRTLVMRLAGIVDANAITSWASGDRQPRLANEQRLRAAYQAFQIVNGADNEFAARSWFIGLNPQLGDETPIDAIRDDRLRDVIISAQAFARTS